MKLLKKQRLKCETLADKLLGAFDWSETKEGFEYWDKIHVKLEAMSRKKE